MDRIDSSKGYVVGNVQFVPTAYNVAKGKMKDEEFRASEDWAKLRAELIAEQAAERLDTTTN